MKERLLGTPTPIARFDLIKPSKTATSLREDQSQSNSINSENHSNLPKPIEIEKVPLLNPDLSKQRRQRTMAFLLMPFGFIAGLTFSQMTGLETFSGIGLGKIGEPLIGSVLGMCSGWIGSYTAAASVNSEDQDSINSLQKRSENGFWLLIITTPLEIELPWRSIKEVNPLEVVRLSDQ